MLRVAVGAELGVRGAAAELDRSAPDVDLTARLDEREQQALVWAAASALGERDASFEAGSVRLTTMLIEGDFPNYRGLIPSSHPNRLTVGRDALLGGIEGIALLLAVGGIYSVTSYIVTQRTREIGVRKALGARRRDIMWQMLVESMTLSGLGALIGIGLGIGLAFRAAMFNIGGRGQMLDTGGQVARFNKRFGGLSLGKK